MKPTTHRQTPQNQSPNRAGAALVLTLGMLVLLSGVVLAFLLTVKTEYGASKGYEGGTNARLLADTALNLVIGQIREASTKPDEAWISQPGLVRTFDQEGKPAKSYKLYSADSLVEDGSFDPAKGSDLPPVLPGSDPGNWKNQPGLWVDMNQPGIDLGRPDWRDASKKLKIYPIFDGNHIAEVTEQGVTTGQMSLHGKIDNATPADIEGFKVEEYKDRQVTMPVKWLYILKDGTLVPAKASGTKGDVEVVVLPEKQKTAQGEPNTVVGRVAFWTDDETAKVNINTASEGTYWDTPVSNGQPGITNAGTTYKSVNDTMFEWDLAARQGAQKEYQRYPGHPATTCLSTIFGRQILLKPEINDDRAFMAEELFKIIPRVTGAEYDSGDITYVSPTKDNSSKAGTARAGSGSGDTTANLVTTDADRLYATIDEFLYNPNFASTRRTWTLAATASKRDTTREMLEMSKFFLTAGSKAPEQNLFNLPRISIWPERVELPSGPSRRTAFDKLIAFCSTVGPKDNPKSLPFYFTRQYGDSSGLTPDGRIDPKGDLSARNMELMDYLKGLTSRQIPGWDRTGAATSTFAKKYPAGPDGVMDSNQILTEIFDYIRCTNLADNSDPTVDSSYTQIKGSGVSFPPDATHSTRGQVVPIEMPDGTRGIGRIATISELALIATRKLDTELPSADQATKAKIQIALIPKFFCPMAGYSALAHSLRVTFEDIEITVKEKNGAAKKPFLDFGKSPYKKQPTLYSVGLIHDALSWASAFGGTIGWTSLNNQWNDLRGSQPDSAPPTAEMIVSNDAGNTLEIQGTVTVKISAPAASTPTNTTNEPVIQTIKCSFPKCTVALPPYKNPWPNNRYSTGYYIVQSESLAQDGSFVSATGSTKSGIRYNNGTEHYLLTDADAVRSLVATGNNLQGDMRLVAARKNVGESYFAPANLAAYTKTAVLNDGTHSMRQGLPHRGSDTGAAFGLLVNGMTGYNPGSIPPGGGQSDMRPDLPAGIDGVVNSLRQSGDWDTGPFVLRDGPYCNKADEGTKPHSVGGTDITPYIGNDYQHQDYQLQGTTFFSPNRQIPSAVMFGSLPTGVMQNRPWQTLLFRPAKYYLPGGDGSAFTPTENNRYASVEHPGSAKYGPPDHLLLDLFWMPVVEPYAISEPFATSGKINLNQQIAPFTNIRRVTGLRAVLKSVKITAMNPKQAVSNGDQAYIYNYKSMSTAGNNGGNNGAWGVISRRGIDLDNTLKQITDRLDKNKPFVSASEICDIPLIPQDVPLVAGLPTPMKKHLSAGFSANTALSQFDSLLKTFWEQHKLTGDNSLEKPYAYIYPRLTTRSNSYTVHVRVQTLAQNSRNSSYILKAAQAQPTGEFRGSFLIERYLDANSAGIVDKNGAPATISNGKSDGLALGPYRFRTVSSKQFVP